MFWRKTSGTSILLQSWMNCAAFCDESENSTPLLPMIPTPKPWMEAQPQTSVRPGGHLHQRRPAEVHARALADEDVVVAHPRLVRATGGGTAEDHRDRRDARARQGRDVVEEAPALGEVRELPAHLRGRVLGA